MAEQQNERENTQGVETPASTSKRKLRLNEAPASPATAEEAKAESQAERSPAWPAQYEGDGWDQVPVQMRP